MKLLYNYLRNYRGLVALALVLATVNQVFSLLDPLIFRHVIDQYATRFQEYTTGQFFRGVSLLLGAAVGVAFVVSSPRTLGRTGRCGLVIGQPRSESTNDWPTPAADFRVSARVPKASSFARSSGNSKG